MPFKGYIDQKPWLKLWGNNSLYTYVELKPGVDIAPVNKVLFNYIEKYQKGAVSKLFLFSMNDWHLHDRFENGKMTGGGRIQIVRLFSIIAWIILLIACINFMNLSTARSEKRAREVGVRKVLGAGKRSLIMQFIGEALLMSFIAAIVAVFIVLVLLPAFNTLVQKELTIGWANPSHLMALLAITVVCGLIAGSYPSLYLSSFNPVSILKGLKLKDSGAAYVRKGLVILQFSISIVLIISTVIVYQQIQHVKNRDLGFNKDNLVEIVTQGAMSQNFNAIKQDLLSTGYIDNAALSDHPTIYGGNNRSGYTWDDKPVGNKIFISVRSVTPEFMATSGFKILEGRNLTLADTAHGGNSVVITQSLEKLMGNGSAIGKILRLEGNSNIQTIVGVINDYVYGNMYGKSDPVVFSSILYQDAFTMYVRIKDKSDTEKALAAIQYVLKKDNPGYPFDYRFVNDEFNKMFSTEILMSKLSRVFSALAIVISCLGLFGLAAYTAERRTKEIGIRKVLGATVGGLAGLLSIDFLKLVVVSYLVAFPLAYWIMQQWLSAMEYRITIQWWVFLLAGISAMFIALLTISFQSIKAAVANPVKSLRSE
jgi:ABC-type antimicrobial peptide transport system permease subunit